MPGLPSMDGPAPPLIRSFIVLAPRRAGGLTGAIAALLSELRRMGVQAVGMKPVARGTVTAEGRWRSEELQPLAAAGAFSLPQRALCSHLLEPGAPEGTPTLTDVVDTYRALATWADAVVVDGADSAGFDGRTLAHALNLPFVYVLEDGPGHRPAEDGIAQARALAHSGLRCAGWVLQCAAGAARDAGRAELQPRMPGECLGTLVHGDHGDSASLDRPRALARLAG